MSIFDFLFSNKHFFRFVFGWKKNGRLNHLNLEEYIETIERHIALLQSLMIKKGDKVGIICETRQEWHFLDMALLAIGAIGIPIYPSFTKKEIDEIHSVCNIDLLIIENPYALKSIDSNFLKQIKVLFIEEGSIDLNINASFYKELLDQAIQSELPSLKELSDNIHEDDICNYLLTSGTTSRPKVSIITHGNLYHLLDNIKFLMKDRLAPGSRSLTHLPLSHVLGRCDSLLHFILPVEVIIGESINSLVSDLQLVKPSYFITVPRVVTKIRERVINNVLSCGRIIGTGFSWAIEYSMKFHRKLDRGEVPSNWDKQTYYFIQSDILKKVRDQISPNLKFIVSGGAPLNNDDYDFFRALGIPIIQGYGLTETLGPVTFNFFGKAERGSVGQPFKDINILIAEDNEILIKGPSIFKGYLNDDGSLDRSAFNEEQFFMTGDIGELLPSGNLKITDRKKDLIVTSYGKNISPLKVEAAMTSSPYIDFFMTVGEGRSYITGLVGISKEAFTEQIYERPELDNGDFESFSRDPQILDIIEKEIKKINEELSDFERVKKFKILPFDLRYEQDFITPSLKIKRGQIYNKFLDLIDTMY